MGTMAGEISPDIMFLKIRQKVTRKRAGGYVAVRLGGHGRISKGGSKNNAKRVPKWANGTCFGMHGQRTKMQDVGMNGHDDQMGVKGSKRVGTRGAQFRLNVFSLRKSKKTNRQANETRKPGRTNMATHTTNCNNKKW